MSWLNWLSEHLDTLMTLCAALHAAALVIVNLTPTPADNLWLTRIYRAIEIVAGIIRAEAKQPGNRATPAAAFPRR